MGVYVSGTTGLFECDEHSKGSEDVLLYMCNLGSLSDVVWRQSGVPNGVFMYVQSHIVYKSIISYISLGSKDVKWHLIMPRVHFVKK